ncbi:MAG: class I SAM-dependent methyltransferase [Phototrophicaceae bacterium]
MIKKILQRFRTKIQPDSLPLLSSVDAYALWVDSYPAEAHNVLMQIEQTSILQLMPRLQDKIVLDLACGTGRYGKIAQDSGATTVIGLDNSVDMLQQRVIQNAACASTEYIPLANNTVDVILCGLALGHLPTIDLSLREMSRILKPNGVILISDFHPYQFLSGARRTFSINNTTYQVEHYVHQLSDYFTIAQQHGLILNAIQEPTYQADIPVVLVLKFSKNIS